MRQLQTCTSSVISLVSSFSLLGRFIAMESEKETRETREATGLSTLGHHVDKASYTDEGSVLVRRGRDSCAGHSSVVADRHLSEPRHVLSCLVCSKLFLFKNLI